MAFRLREQSIHLNATGSQFAEHYFRLSGVVDGSASVRFRCDGQTGYRWHPPCRLVAQDLPGFRTLRPHELLHRVKGAPHRKAWIKSQCANAVACSSVCRRKCVQKWMRNLRQLCAPSRPPHWKPTSSFLPPGVAYVTRPPCQETLVSARRLGKSWSDRGPDVGIKDRA